MTTSTPATRDGQDASSEALVSTIWEALCQYNPIRMWRDTVQVEAHAGDVVLSGVVRSHTARETAERIARAVKGVSAVENKLVVDADVEVAIAQALGADPRTRGGFPGILVGVVFGYVYLKGAVAAAEIKNAAGEVALKVAGVRSVSNELSVPPDTKTAKPPATKAGAPASAAA
jgi:osmotically-inducible protein OsmY